MSIVILKRDIRSEHLGFNGLTERGTCHFLRMPGGILHRIVGGGEGGGGLGLPNPDPILVQTV